MPDAEPPPLVSTPRDWVRSSRGRSHRSQQRTRRVSLALAAAALAAIVAAIVWLVAFSSRSVPPLHLMAAGITDYPFLPPHPSGRADARAVLEVAEVWSEGAERRVLPVPFSDTLQGAAVGSDTGGSFLTNLQNRLADAQAAGANVVLLVSMAAVETSDGLALVAIDARPDAVAARSGGGLIPLPKVLERIRDFYLRPGNGTLVLALDLASPGPDWTLGTLADDLSAATESELRATLSTLGVPPDRLCVLLAHRPGETNNAFRGTDPDAFRSTDPDAIAPDGLTDASSDESADPSAIVTENVLGRSVFGQALAEALRGRADGLAGEPDSVVTVDELARYVGDRVGELTAGTQSVARFGSGGGRSLLATQIARKTWPQLREIRDGRRLGVDRTQPTESEMMDRVARERIDSGTQSATDERQAEVGQTRRFVRERLQVVWERTDRLASLDDQAGRLMPALSETRRLAAHAHRLLLSGLAEQAAAGIGEAERLLDAIEAIAPPTPDSVSIAAREAIRSLHPSTQPIDPKRAAELEIERIERDSGYDELGRRIESLSPEELAVQRPLAGLSQDDLAAMASRLWSRAIADDGPSNLRFHRSVARRLEAALPREPWPSELVWLAGLPDDLTDAELERLNSGGFIGATIGSRSARDARDPWEGWRKVTALRATLSSLQTPLAAAAAEREIAELVRTDLQAFVRSVIAAERWLRSDAAPERQDTAWLDRAGDALARLDRRSRDLMAASRLRATYRTGFPETAAWAASAAVMSREAKPNVIDSRIPEFAESLAGDEPPADSVWPLETTGLGLSLLAAARAYRELDAADRAVREMASPRGVGDGGSEATAAGRFERLSQAVGEAERQWQQVVAKRTERVTKLLRTAQPTLGEMRLTHALADKSWFADPGQRALLDEALAREPTQTGRDEAFALESTYFGTWGLLTLHTFGGSDRKMRPLAEAWTAMQRADADRAKQNAQPRAGPRLGERLADGFASLPSGGHVVGWGSPPVAGVESAAAIAAVPPGLDLIRAELVPLWLEPTAIADSPLAIAPWQRAVTQSADVAPGRTPQLPHLRLRRPSSGELSADGTVALTVETAGNTRLDRVVRQLRLLDADWAFGDPDRPRRAGGEEIDAPDGIGAQPLDLTLRPGDRTGERLRASGESGRVVVAALGSVGPYDDYPIGFLPLDIQPQRSTDGWSIAWRALPEGSDRLDEAVPIRSNRRNGWSEFVLPPYTLDGEPVRLVPVLTVDRAVGDEQVTVTLEIAATEGQRTIRRRLTDEPVALPAGASTHLLPLPTGLESVDVRHGIAFEIATPQTEPRSLRVVPRLHAHTQFARVEERGIARDGFAVRVRARERLQGRGEQIIVPEAVPLQLHDDGDRAGSRRPIGVRPGEPGALEYGGDRRLVIRLEDAAPHFRRGTERFEAWLDVAGWPGAYRWRVDGGAITRLSGDRTAVRLLPVRAGGPDKLRIEPDGTVLVSDAVNASLVSLPLEAAIYSRDLDWDDDPRQTRWTLRGRLYNVTAGAGELVRRDVPNRPVASSRRERVRLTAGSGGVWEMATAVAYHRFALSSVDSLPTGRYELRLALERRSDGDEASAGSDGPPLRLTVDRERPELLIALAPDRESDRIGEAAADRPLAMRLGRSLVASVSGADAHSGLQSVLVWVDRDNDGEPGDDEAVRRWGRQPNERPRPYARRLTFTDRELPSGEGVSLVRMRATDRAGNVGEAKAQFDLVKPKPPKPAPSPAPPKASEPTPQKPAMATKPPDPKPAKPKPPPRPGSLRVRFNGSYKVRVEGSGPQTFRRSVSFDESLSVPSLKPGAYTIVFEKGSGSTRKSVSKTVTIEPGQTETIDVAF